MKLFYDDEFDALTTAIGNSGKKFGDVAMHMFPDMKAESAYARLKVCVSSLGDQRLSFGQVIRLMAYCEAYDPLYYACDETLHARPDRKAYDPLYYACDETLHARPDRKAPEDEAVKLAEVINSAAQTMERAMKAMNHLQARGGMRAVS